MLTICGLLRAMVRTAACAAAITILAVMVQTLHAQTIPIANANFNSDFLRCAAGPQCFDLGVIPGWVGAGPTIATFKPSTGQGGEYPGGIPGGGPNVAGLGQAAGAGVITQDLGFAPLPNTTYTLSVYVGQRADFTLAGYALELLVGTTSVASDSSARPAAGSFAFDSVTYRSGASPISGNLTIRLSAGGGGQADFVQVALTATTVGPVTMVLPQLAFGGGWYTALYFTNLSGSSVSFRVDFVGNDGNPLAVSAVGGSSTTVNLTARGTARIEIPNEGPLVQGYVLAALPTGVTGYGVFRQSVAGMNDQEAVVPLSGTTATTTTLVFDDTNYITGVAVVNLASLNASISVAAYDSQGNLIGVATLPMAAFSKTAVALRDIPGLSAVSGSRGSVDFTTSIGRLAALGLRFNGLAFTSIPTADR